MSILNEYFEVKRKQQEIVDQLARFESNAVLMRALEFQRKLDLLMQEYNQSPQEVGVILGLTDGSTVKTKSTDKRKAGRALKRYVNPHSGEVVETKGGNHKVLNAWREQYGKDVVDSWLQA